MNPLLTLFNLDGVFCDALVHDDQDNLIFTSLWGRDTALQELLARLTLPVQEGGIATLVFKQQGLKTVHLNNLNLLDKLTGRMPKINIFGNLAQLWLFDKRIRTPDFANQKAYLLLEDRFQTVINMPKEAIEASIWSLFKSVCHLPMLDAWQETILALLKNEQWLKSHPGFGALALEIALPCEVFEQRISQLILSKALTL